VKSSAVVRRHSLARERSAGSGLAAGEALRQAVERLAHTDAPGVTAQALMGQVLGLSRAQVLARPEQELTPDEAAALAGLVARAAAGEPLAYLTGTREFCGLACEVDANVLVPRPETEQLVELALRRSPPPGRIVDVGTGSGCIAVTLARRLPEAKVWAVDVSEAALAVAQRNAERHGVAGRIAWVEGDLLDAWRGDPARLKAGGFDLIVANLPYIDSEALNSLTVAAHEPRLALDGGPGGLALVERLLAQAAGALAAGGTVLLEIGAGQGERAAALGQRAFPGAAVIVHPDLAGLERVLAIHAVSG
jgi:release factor glutamine methyltransferase